MKCNNCPVSSNVSCLGETRFKNFCEWAKDGDPVKLSHIINRSSGDVKFPPVTTQAFSLIEAVGRFVASGMEKRSEPEVEKILDICKACEYFDSNRCKLCGCNLVKKIAMKSESCPIKKW